MDNPNELSLADAIARFKSATVLATDFTSGDATLDVIGDEGTYPSLAKLTVQAKQELTLLQARAFANTGTNDMTKGQPVYATSDLGADLANAASSTQKIVIGLVTDDLVESGSGRGLALSTGVLTATVEQWTAATGMVGGLIPRTNYFLSLVSGQITPFPPSGDGQSVCPLGRALTTTDFLINIDRPIDL